MNEQKILKLVELLASHDSVEQIPERQTNSDKLLVAIYKIIHSHRQDHCCKVVHQDWRDEAKKTFEDNKKYF